MLVPLVADPAHVGQPTIELEPTEHPLAVEQRTGITVARACEIVHSSMPNDPWVPPALDGDFRRVVLGHDTAWTCSIGAC